MSQTYGAKLDPYRRLREPLGVKGVRTNYVVTNVESTINANQLLVVRFPNLGENDVIVPGSTKLAFNIVLTSTDANRTLVNNIGRAIVKKLVVKLSGNEILSVDDADVFYCYQDLWKTTKERDNAQYQGIDTSDSRNVTRLRIGAGNANPAIDRNTAVSDALDNRFCIPLDHEILSTHMPFYQKSLADKLEFELWFNTHDRVIQAVGDPDASYRIENISLEYEVVHQPDIARLIRNQYSNQLAFLYDRVLRHRVTNADKSDAIWTFHIPLAARSMKGVLFLFEDPAGAFLRDPEYFYNPKITRVETTIEGVSNQLYSDGLRAYQMWDEAKRYFGGGTRQHGSQIMKTTKCQEQSDVTLEDYLTNRYCLWLDLRSSDDDSLHGSGRKFDNVSGGITVQINKTAEAAGQLRIYTYVIMDAQLNLQDGRFVSALY